METVTGRCVLRLGDDVNTDLIYPGRYLKISDPAEIGAHALEGVPEAAGVQIRPGDILVAGANFGCGSSRTQSVLSLTARGIRAVVARSFARSYFRNSVNHGLPAVICPEAHCIDPGDLLTIDLAGRTLRTPRQALAIEAYPPFLLELMRRGGLVQLGKGILEGTVRLDVG